ncbi:Lung seven transmembrane receptor [Musa troglodytarum]|uniref:Lung seven transmembrane receptor n=1 Tax=Musa troglodytarum TaxID=320322 RepID=A0A9E7KSQ3_9LILI|nr:Lung seven transmembrane receptor [Musa troglodytarum]
MARSLRPHLLLLLFLIVLASISSCTAEIKNLKISSDFRAIILFEKFGFSPRGEVAIAVSDVSVSFTLGASDGSLLGFFLPSDESLIQAAHDSQHGGSTNSDTTPSPNPRCVLHSSYVRVLFTFDELSLAPSAA